MNKNFSQDLFIPKPNKSKIKERLNLIKSQIKEAESKLAESEQTEGSRVNSSNLMFHKFKS